MYVAEALLCAHGLGVAGYRQDGSHAEDTFVGAAPRYAPAAPNASNRADLVTVDGSHTVADTSVPDPGAGGAAVILPSEESGVICTTEQQAPPFVVVALTAHTLDGVQER